MPTVPSGGCIRLYPAVADADGNLVPQPEWHIDENHQPEGIFDTSEPPTIDSGGYLVIKLIDPETGGPNTLPVIRMTAGPDETLTARHINGGCSNGGPIMRIRLTHKDLGPLDLKRADHWAICAGKNANLWPGARHKAP